MLLGFSDIFRQKPRSGKKEADPERCRVCFRHLFQNGLYHFEHKGKLPIIAMVKQAVDFRDCFSGCHTFTSNSFPTR